MAEVHDRIEQCIEAFTEDMSELVRRVAFESVSRALAGEPAMGPDGPVTSKRAARRPGKRTNSEIERTTRALENHIRSTPGRRMEELTIDLGVDSRELSLPIRRLLDAGRIRSEGKKRATRYFPV